MEEAQVEYKEFKFSPVSLLWTIGLTVLLTVSMNFFLYFLPSMAACNLQVGDLIPTAGVDLLGIPFLMIVFTMVLMRIPSVKRHLTTENLVFMYVVALASSGFSDAYAGWRETYEPLTARIGTAEDIMQYVPNFVSPAKEAAEALVTGTGSIGAIPWSLLLPAMIWRFLSFAIFIGISVGVSSIFRRQWIDIEMLPYPQVMIAHSAMSGARDVWDRGWTGRLPFVAGFLAGFILEMIRMLIIFFPWFPDVYAFRANTCGPGAHQIAWGGIPFHMNIAKHTPLYALLMLVPLHSLWSMVFFGIVYEALSTAAYYTGYYTGYVDMGPCGRSWCVPGTPFADPPLNFGSLITGVYLGVFVMTVFLERRHIARTIKAMAGRRNEKELESAEAMSYRSAYTILVVSYALLMALYVYAGISLWVSFVLVLTSVVTWFTASQLWGRVGFGNEPGYNFAPGFLKMLVWPDQFRLPVTSTDLVLAPSLNYELDCGPYMPHATTFYATLGTYKMSSLAGVHPKNMIKAVVVALMVGAFMASILNMVIPGVYGLGTSWMRGSYDLMGRIDTVWTKPSPRPMTEIAPWVLAGFAFVVAVKLIQARFLWVPDPFMSIVAWDWVGSLFGTWMAASICAVLKWIILKIGGSKLYSERVVPFVGGFILGDVLNALIAGVLAVSMFRVT
ncbi:MAG: hypothetical protein JTT11_07390 [Candidatus Brockarchaeota archaeon]|nr:hypothetical protein [Candidatus Brockarchaeota archaeon]